MKSRWLAKGTSAVAMIAVMGTATICPAPANAGVPGVFATEYTQLLNYVELVGQLEKQVLMVENQLTQIADMTKNGLPITDQLFGTVGSDIAELRQVVNTGCRTTCLRPQGHRARPSSSEPGRPGSRRRGSSVCEGIEW